MKKLKFKSLTMRIWTTFTAIILIIVFSISLLYLFAFKKMNENAKIQDLKVAHDILLKSGDFSKPSRFDEMRNLRGSSHFIISIDENENTRITDIGKDPGKDPGTPPPIPPERHGIMNVNDDPVKTWMAGYITEGDIFGKQYVASYRNMKFIFVISSVSYGNTGKSYLITYMPEMEDNSLLYLVLIVGAAFIAISFLAAKIVANYLSKPLKELEDYTVRIAKKDWEEPIGIKSEDEIGRLAGSMNHMRKELKRADEEEKLFLQSISHDLKTPVMVILSHAEAIMDGVYIDSIEKTAEIIKDEAVNLDRKIKQMLYLNTLDYVLDNSNEDVAIDLRNLIRYIISRFEVVNSKIEWDLDMDEITIRGNEDKIRVSIENILDNGLRYAEKKIGISLKARRPFAVLEIYNDGPNIDEVHMSHIFDNFYKDKTGNFGLGLAISKKIINFYHGEIMALNKDKGVSFIIRFPVIQK